MSDISLTINNTIKNFDLAKDEHGKKAIMIREDPVVPIRALSNIPKYGDLPADKVLAFDQSTWRGGIGQQDHYQIDDLYSDGQTIDTREPNKMFLGPSLNNTVDNTHILYNFTIFNNFVYAINDYGVWKYTEVSPNNTWTLVLSNIHVSCLCVYDSHLYAGLYIGKYFWSADGASWTQTTLANSDAVIKFIVAPPFSGTQDVLVLAQLTNVIRTCVDPTNNAGVGWTNPPYYIGDSSSDITGMFILAGELYIGKWDGLYFLDSTGTTTRMVSDIADQNSMNWAQSTNLQGVIYTTFDDSILEIIGSSSTSLSLSLVGPFYLNREMSNIGRVTGLTSDSVYLYATIYFDSTNTTAVYVGHERTDDVYGLRWEWTPLFYSPTYVINAPMVIQKVNAAPILWLCGGSGAKFITLPKTVNPLGYSFYTFNTQGYLITSYFDAGYDIWNKIYFQLWTMASNLDTTHQYIKIYYEKDTDSSWTLAVTLTTNGISFTNLTSISCQRIRLKIELDSDNPLKTPILNEFILRGVLQPELIRTLDLTVILDQAPSRKVSLDMAFLESGRVSTTPIKLIDLRFNTTKYIVFMPSSPMEIEVLDEAGGQPSYQARIQAQVINWTLP